MYFVETKLKDLELQFEATNYDLQNIVTPVDVEALEKLLIETKYRSDERNFVVDGFRFGFPLQYRGPTKRRQTARNLPLNCGKAHNLWKK